MSISVRVPEIRNCPGIANGRSGAIVFAGKKEPPGILADAFGSPTLELPKKRQASHSIDARRK
jgi:hypothetical protein